MRAPDLFRGLGQLSRHAAHHARGTRQGTRSDPPAVLPRSALQRRTALLSAAMASTAAAPLGAAAGVRTHISLPRRAPRSRCPEAENALLQAIATGQGGRAILAALTARDKGLSGSIRVTTKNGPDAVLRPGAVCSAAGTERVPAFRRLHPCCRSVLASPLAETAPPTPERVTRGGRVRRFRAERAGSCDRPVLDTPCWFRQGVRQFPKTVEPTPLSLCKCSIATLWQDYPRGVILREEWRPSPRQPCPCDGLL